ncbi:MAG: glycosyltransferase family 2 protein, partial [Gammaproteobacteria bacterium]|nr:glycosyltransferase family 2 protein [Gammaproteobacteria bacterium]
LTVRPVFDVVIWRAPSPGGDGRLEATMASVQAQLYPPGQVRVVKDAQALGPLLGALSDWCVVVREGDLLAPHALYWIAEQIGKAPDVHMVYADHDYLSDTGERFDPQFKPDWSQELLRACDYLAGTFAFHAPRLKAPFSPDQPPISCLHDLALRLSEATDARHIAHIPALLWHLSYTGHTAEGGGTASHPVRSHLHRLGIAAQVTELDARNWCVRYALPARLPSVTIIIPTRDGLPVLRPCVDSVLEKTRYPDFDVLIVDNGSVMPETLAYFSALRDDARVQILRDERPFNYSALNNGAVARARGELVCLLNNDTEVITPDWLSEMVANLMQPGVGVVGAKLYYSDGRVQHAGDVVGPGGCADHLHNGIAREDPGYMRRASLRQELSAVTAACLLTHRALYQRLGGLDEHNLPVAFNDVDYCLRVRATGVRIVWTP